MRIIQPPSNFQSVVNQAEKKYRDDIEDLHKESMEAWLADKLAYYQTLENTTVLPAIQGKVLELGAGRCWLTALISRFSAVTEIYAVDLSEKLIKDLAPSTIDFLHGQKEKITLMINDFNNLDFPAASFDTILFDAAVHHAPDPVPTLRKVATLLKPTGKLICIREPIIPPLYYFNKAAVYRAHGVNEKQYGVTENIFTLPEWRTIFQQANLSFRSVKVNYTMIRNPFLKNFFGHSFWNGLLYSEMVFIAQHPV